MTTLADLLEEDTDWLAAIRQRDAEQLRGVLAYESDVMTAATIWASAKFGVAGDNAAQPSRQAKRLVDYVQDEVHEFLCAEDKYQSERAELVQKGADSRTAVVALIAANIGPYFEGGATVILPIVALILTIIGRVGLRAWCAMQRERRNPDDAGPSSG